MARLREDPIMAELHAIRRARAKKFNYDVVAMINDLREAEATSGREYITMPQSAASVPEECPTCGRPLKAQCINEST